MGVDFFKTIILVDSELGVLYMNFDCLDENTSELIIYAIWQS